jgi:hypothetical protein
MATDVCLRVKVSGDASVQLPAGNNSGASGVGERAAEAPFVSLPIHVCIACFEALFSVLRQDITTKCLEDAKGEQAMGLTLSL